MPAYSLTKYPSLSFFKTEFARQVHYLNIDSLQLALLQSTLSFCISIFLILFLKRTWIWTKNNFAFILLYASIEIVFVLVPCNFIADFLISPKYGSTTTFTESVSKILSLAVPSLLSQVLMVLFCLAIAKLTSLPQYPYEEAPQTQTEQQTTSPNPLDVNAPDGFSDGDIEISNVNQNLTQNLNQDTRQNMPAVENEVRVEARGCRSYLKDKFWIVLYICIFALIFIINAYSPQIYMAAAGRFTPLERLRSNEEKLVATIKNLTDFAGLEFSLVYVQEEGSPNAMLIGIISKRLIIVRSIMSLVSPMQLAAIVAHEIGHWKHGDIPMMLVGSSIFFFVMALFIRYIQKRRLAEFGAKNAIPVSLMFFICSVFFSCFLTVLAPVGNAFKRRFERNADCYAAQLGYPIGEALSSVFGGLTQTKESSKVYSIFKEDHPPLSTRLKDIKACTKSKNGQ